MTLSVAATRSMHLLSASGAPAPHVSETVGKSFYASIEISGRTVVVGSGLKVTRELRGEQAKHRLVERGVSAQHVGQRAVQLLPHLRLLGEALAEEPEEFHAEALHLWLLGCVLERLEQLHGAQEADEARLHLLVEHRLAQHQHRAVQKVRVPAKERLHSLQHVCKTCQESATYGSAHPWRFVATFVRGTRASREPSPCVPTARPERPPRDESGACRLRKGKRAAPHIETHRQGRCRSSI